MNQILACNFQRDVQVLQSCIPSLMGHVGLQDLTPMVLVVFLKLKVGDAQAKRHDQQHNEKKQYG